MVRVFAIFNILEIQTQQVNEILMNHLGFSCLSCSCILGVCIQASAILNLEIALGLERP